MGTWRLSHSRNKYKAKRTTFQGRKYDSKLEAGLAAKIEMLIRAGEIKSVQPQKTFALYGKNGAKVCSHRVDFLVTMPDDSQQVWESKGYILMGGDVWRLKRNLFVDNYPEIEYVVFTK